MRISIYRGKPLEGDLWVYGSLVQAWGRCFITEQSEEADMIKGVEVLPESVGQCSDISDLNDNPIYEGDICSMEILVPKESPSDNPNIIRLELKDDYVIGWVEFIDGMFLLCYNSKDGHIEYHHLDEDMMEVIGNKTENDYLLS